jgi:hypothetical protein
VKAYSQSKDKDQSLYSSDTSRLTYIINELQECGKIKWTVDKKGIKVKKYVITPLLEYLRTKLEKYVNKNSTKSSTHVLIKLQAVMKLFELIDKEILANNIVRYIAPYFCLLKDENDSKQITA